MEIDPRSLEQALRRILEVERNHLHGAKTGSPTARRGEVEREVERVLENLVASPKSTS